LRDGRREGVIDKYLQSISCAGGAADIKTMLEVEFIQCMQAYDVIKMKMAEEKVGGLAIPFMYIPVQFVKAVTGIENNLIICCPYKNTDCISRLRIVPPICS
jgi:hypothetical protein